VLVFDADAGGSTGVDRALEVFIRSEMDLRVATLPEGLDPCDLLVRDGPEPFQSALTKAVDVLEFKLVLLARQADVGIENQRRAVDEVLGTLALIPNRNVKLELTVTRIAQRLGLKEETLWARLEELRRARRDGDRPRTEPMSGAVDPRREEQSATAPVHEVELLEVLLAEPAMVPAAQKEIAPEQVEHPGLRLLVEALYRLHAEGTTATLDQLRIRIDKPKLMEKALELQERGLAKSNRQALLTDVLARFRQKRVRLAKEQIYGQLRTAQDHDAARELLRKLQNQPG